MNRRAIIMGLALSLLACARIEEAPTPAPEYQAKELIITAYGGDDDTNTKTARQVNTDVYWSPGDAISLFFRSGENGGSRFVAQNTEEVAITQFKGTIDVISGGGEDTGGEFWFWGIYPYSTENSCDGSSITTVIPAQQTGKAGTFADNTFITMARAKGLELGFYNICSGVKFTLSRNDIKEVRIRGNNNEDIAGKIKAEWDVNGKPVVAQYIEGAKEVSVAAPGGGTFAAGTEYYLVIAPTLFSDGFTMTLLTSDFKYGEFVYGSERQFKRSIFTTIPDLDTRVNSWAEPSKAFLPNNFLPNEVDKTTITEAYFHTSDPTTTATIISAGDSEYEPIYFEMIGTVAHFYTTGQVYKSTAFQSSFEDWESLQSLDLSMFNISEVISMSSAFMNCRSLRSLDLSSFDTSNVCSFDNMFCNCEALIYLDLSHFNTSKAYDMHGMFSGCHSLKRLDVSSWDTAFCTSIASMFSDCYSLERLDVSNWDTSSCLRMNAIFSGCHSLEQLDVSNWDTSRCSSLAYMFYGCNSLSAIDVSNFVTSSCTTMAYMFHCCQSLKTIDVSSFDMSNALDCRNMFSDCSSLQTIDVSSWQTSNVQNTYQMFAGCRKLSSLDLTGWDLGSIINAYQMFSSCFGLKSVAFPNTGTPNLQNMEGMFYLCSNLTNISFNGLSTSNVTSMSQLFAFCSSLKSLDLSSFDTSSVISMNQMFVKCTGLTELDLSSFDTQNVSDMSQMFCSCYNLSVLNLGSFDTSSLEHADYFLDGLFNLTKLDIRSVNFPPQVSLTDAFGFASTTIGDRISHCHIRCSSETKNTIIGTNNSIGSNSKYIWYEPEVALPDNVDEKDPSLYYSTDYSMDRKVVLKQAATEGNGLDIVIMGDGFSDRLIADGTYDDAMNAVLDAVFAEEPFKSFKHLFNIYVVYAVSENEIIGKNTAFLTTDSRGDWAGAIGSWDEDKVRAFAIMASSKSDTREITPIVVLNSSNNDGSVKTQISFNSEYLSDPNWDDYHGGENFTYISGPFTPDISYTAVHEMGHAFGQLADEYLYEGYEDYSNNSYFQSIWPNWCVYGMYKNIDFTSDVNSVKWKHFLNDSRYTNECLNCYEGAMFKYGIWRPTENSIMRNDHDGHYNAPSREAIYYRIHKLAYGKDWVYNFEDFVQWDLKNIPQAAPSPAPVKRASSSASVNRKHIFKMEESITEDGKKMITIIQN